MRKLLAILLGTALGLSGCASPQPTPAPTPEPEPEPPAVAVADTAELPDTVPEPREDTVLAAIVPPDNWWTLDLDQDNVPGISLIRARTGPLAYRTPARTVVVGVIDSGIDIHHEALRANIWINTGEVPGSGRDDDGNGYVDDVHGWNFIGGADGRNVDQDTYELTRLKAQCRAHGARAPPEWPYHCEEISAAFQAKVAETRVMLQQVQQMDYLLNLFKQLLLAHLRVDSLTLDKVAAIRSVRPEVMEARRIYLELAADGITPGDVSSEIDRLENLLEYGLDPDFDPRPIVGDDPDDLTQRYYGNPDVRGPRADHGTHVAGIIGGVPVNDDAPMTGIAPAVRIMPIRAVPDGDERDKDVANAIRYAVDNGAHIINMSFGKGFSPDKAVVDEAVRYADAHGVLLIHAAGNDGADLDQEPNYPSRYYLDGDSALHWLEVGASGWRHPEQLVAPFSNYGRTSVDVFAPGVAIRSTVPDNEFATYSGTSMAAPVVTGIAALIMTYYPELEAETVRRIILDSASDYGDMEVIRPGTGEELVPFAALSRTGGIVNAYAAVLLAEELARSGNSDGETIVRQDASGCTGSHETDEIGAVPEGIGVGV